MEKLNTSMDASASSWISDLLLEEKDDCNLFRQCHQDLLDVEGFLSHDIVSALQQPLSSEGYSCYTSNSETFKNSSTEETSLERPTKLLVTNSYSWNSSTIMEHFSPNLSLVSFPSSPTSQILSFENSNSNSSPANTTLFHGFHCTLNPKQNEVVSVSPPQPRNVNFTTQTQKGSSKKQKIETKNPQSQGTVRSPTNVQDHIMAERKRREKLSQSVVALAALIPGLKKMDKVSVLGDAIEYVKKLQERLRLLEEQRNKRAVNSMVIVNNDSSLCESFDAASCCEARPHVKARVLEKDVLLRIHCPKRKDILPKLLVEIQNLRLFVLSSSVLPFGDSILDITIVAQMGTGYDLSINDLVKKIRVATLKFMS
ncbi:transcription factor bHLH18-like [Gastrolobium bilobum]|uniref:transcription factor bHLH18-like n=1 Tax=Gastrolobium bilobum TaxID=150636 RepID=UPI002AAF4E74|nr:transcription factor bHLH18-like [Gastrolobium bilobum]